MRLSLTFVLPRQTMEARKAMILMETSGEAEFGLPIFLSVMAAWLATLIHREAAGGVPGVVLVAVSLH